MISFLARALRRTRVPTPLLGSGARTGGVDGNKKCMCVCEGNIGNKVRGRKVGIDILDLLDILHFFPCVCEGGGGGGGVGGGWEWRGIVCGYGCGHE